MPALDNSPELFVDAIPYWTAFAELSSSRQLGMSLGPIPYSEISCWLDENIIYSMEERVQYRHLIISMDTKFMEIHNDKQKKKK